MAKSLAELAKELKVPVESLTKYNKPLQNERSAKKPPKPS